MTLPSLFFRGTRPGRAQIVSTEIPITVDPDGVETRDLTRAIFRIEAPDPGRPFELSGTSGVWRDLSELNLADPDAVIRFIRKRGWLFRKPEDPPAETTARWRDLQGILKGFSEAWQVPSGENGGISAIADEEKARAISGAFMREHDRGRVYMRDIEDVLVGDDSGRSTELIAKTFGAHMFLSGWEHLQTRAAMKRCLFCTGWFAMSGRRSDSRFCARSCRTQFGHRLAAAKGRA